MAEELCCGKFNAVQEAIRIDKHFDVCILSKLITTMETKIEDSTLYAVIRSMFDANVLNLNFGGFPKGLGLLQEG
ncbi:hypothetical protein ACET3Z_027833 [Daucus carota]